MILRKPYAFLIKYFGIIHIIMFIMFGYLVFKIRAIYMFFKDYISNNYMYFENIATRYVPLSLILIIILLLALAISILFLMRKKEKPILFYKFIIIYCSILIIALIYFYFFFKSLSNTNYEPLRIVINRDIILGIYIINYIFVAFSFIRAFGFDIKKFSFERDRKELMLEEGDNEEYEVKINVEKGDVKKFVRKQKREFGYYVKENSRIFTIVGTVLGIALISYFAINNFVTNRVYSENDDIKINGISYNINKSTVTKYDKYGRIISNDDYYLVVYLNINTNDNKVTLNDQQFRLYANNEYYYPASNACGYFEDLGSCYHDRDIGNVNKQYIVVFKLNGKTKKADFEILKNKNSYSYTKVKLAPVLADQESVDYNILDTFTVNNVDLKVTKYQLTDKTSYNYQECQNDKCNTYTKIISPKVGNKVMALTINNQDKLTDDFIQNYFGLKHRNIILYGNSIELINRYDDVIYLDVPNTVRADDRLVLTINTRKKEYNILLKEGIDE